MAREVFLADCRTCRHVMVFDDRDMRDAHAADHVDANTVEDHFVVLADGVRR